MRDADHDHDPSSPPDDPPGDGSGAGPTTPYTAPCRRCGRRVHLTEDELVASLAAPPLCWFCATGSADP